jgi:hypothetical protein
VPELVTPVVRGNRIIRNRAWRRHRSRQLMGRTPTREIAASPTCER